MIFAFTVLALIGLILIGVLPIWPFSRGWGYGPAVIIGLVLFILLVMTLTGHVPGMGELPRKRALRLGSAFRNNTQVRVPPAAQFDIEAARAIEPLAMIDRMAAPCQRLR